MLDRVARLTRAPCLLARGTRLGGVDFCHVNRSSRANQGEINHENMAVRGEYFRSYHLPVLSAKQNNSQSEEINVIDESQAENRPVFVQEAEIWWKKFPLSAVMFIVLSGRSRDNSRSPLTVPVRWVACKGRLCFNPSRRVAQLAGAPSFHVNRPLLMDITSPGKKNLRVHFLGVVWTRISDPRSVWIMVHQRNQWIHSGHGFVSYMHHDRDRSWITDPDPDHPKEMHLKRCFIQSAGYNWTSFPALIVQEIIKEFVSACYQHVLVQDNITVL